jgi:hypothetical protein
MKEVTFYLPETLSLIGWRLPSDEVTKDIGGEAVVYGV